MPKYQVSYRNQSRPFNINLEAVSHLEIIDFFQNIVNAELVDIKEVVYANPVYPKDDGDYIKSVSCLISNESSFYSFKIPKMKKTVTDQELTNLIVNHIKLGGISPKNLKITKKI